MTHSIKILRETPKTVTIARSDFEALIQAAEDAEDLAAVAEHDAEVARIGKDVARRDYLSTDEVEALLKGVSPLKVWRKKRGLTQRALAAAAGVQPGYLAEIEHGKKPGSADALRRLSVALRVPMENLIGRSRKA
jgi:DNA-binding XRE family transcriptional regulator